MIIRRIELPKILEEQRRAAMKSVAEHLQQELKPIAIYFFGSVTREDFDAMSDIDVLCIFETPMDALAARRTFYSARPRPPVEHIVEALFFDKQTFDLKSEEGGICFVAKYEGVLFQN